MDCEMYLSRNNQCFCNRVIQRLQVCYSIEPEKMEVISEILIFPQIDRHFLLFCSQMKTAVKLFAFKCIHFKLRATTKDASLKGKLILVLIFFCINLTTYLDFIKNSAVAKAHCASMLVFLSLYLVQCHIQVLLIQNIRLLPNAFNTIILRQSFSVLIALTVHLQTLVSFFRQLCKKTGDKTQAGLPFFDSG